MLLHMTDTQEDPDKTVPLPCNDQSNGGIMGGETCGLHQGLVVVVVVVGRAVLCLCQGYSYDPSFSFCHGVQGAMIPYHHSSRMMMW